jgi:hypothetical protein
VNVNRKKLPLDALWRVVRKGDWRGAFAVSTR